MGASSICFECPAGVFARPVLRTISAVSGVNGGEVQVIFGMVVVLVRFAFKLILFVVIMGFAMALFSLLRDADTFNFEDILLLLFKTLLGDVEACFEEFGDSARNRFSFTGNLSVAGLVPRGYNNNES
ncbi:unnamed protein product [Ascophyllum nodosum]